MGYVHISKNDRNEISILLQKGYSHRVIGQTLRKDRTTIDREVKNNSVKGQYDPQKAHLKAYVKRKYSKYQGMKIDQQPWLAEYIEKGLKEDDWTPEEIAGRLKHLNGGKTVISFKAIYKFLYRNPLGYHLCQYLLSQRVRPRKRRKKKKMKREMIKNRVFIDQRPLIINQRKYLGDFEGDTMGKPKGMKETIVVLSGRKSRWLLVKKVSQLKYAMDGLKELIKSVPVKSITLDNGVENVRHQELGIPTYFCHPYSPWEKGTVENSIKRLRRYIPKRANPANYSQKKINAIVAKMNNTPRKCLGFKTPNEVFNEQHLEKSKPGVVHLRG